MKAGLVLNSSPVSMVLGTTLSIKVDELAAAMIDLALDGSERQILENVDLVKKGRELMTQASTPK